MKILILLCLLPTTIFAQCYVHIFIGNINDDALFQGELIMHHNSGDTKIYCDTTIFMVDKCTFEYRGSFHGDWVQVYSNMDQILHVIPINGELFTLDCNGIFKEPLILDIRTVVENEVILIEIVLFKDMGEIFLFNGVHYNLDLVTSFYPMGQDTITVLVPYNYAYTLKVQNRTWIRVIGRKPKLLLQQ